MVLSGVGDLIVTGTLFTLQLASWGCSRTWRKLEDIEANMGMIIEGISTTKVAHELAQELDVYMPITQAIYQVIYEGKDIRETYPPHDEQ